MFSESWQRWTPHNVTPRYCKPWQTKAGCSQTVPSNHAQQLSLLQVRARDSAHDFIVQACVQHSSFPDWRNAWLHEVLLTMLMEQQTVTKFAVINHWFMCNDKTLNQHLADSRKGHEDCLTECCSERAARPIEGAEKGQQGKPNYDW